MVSPPLNKQKIPYFRSDSMIENNEDRIPLKRLCGRSFDNIRDITAVTQVETPVINGSQNEQDLILKYIVNRDKPKTRLEIAQTLQEFCIDLEKIMPSHKFILGYMKSLVQCLTNDSDSDTVSGNKYTDDEPILTKTGFVSPIMIREENKDFSEIMPHSDTKLKTYSLGKRWFRYKDVINNNSNNGLQKFNGFRQKLLNATRNSGGSMHIYATSEKVTPQSCKSGLSKLSTFSKYAQQAKENIRETKKSLSSTKLIISKLQFEKLSEKVETKEIKGYMEEFMDKYDEFSTSWRKEAESMKTVGEKK